MTSSARTSLPIADESDFTQRIGPGFLVGVYLGVNAVRDLYLLVEGPDCVHMKTQYVQGNHDWCSTLTSVAGFHRIANTALHPDQISGSREEELRETLVRIASHEAVPAVMLTSMPMAFITGADYSRLTGEVAETTGKPVLHIPGKSLAGDWLDGYAELLISLATQLELPGGGGAPDPHRVGVVGYLHDRNEEDHTANHLELARLLEGLGLELVSVWLSGQRFADLVAIAEAGTIISLPYGRRAARKLAKRTGAQLVETPLPFGLPATEQWVRQLAAHFGVEARGEALIDRELAAVVPQLEWVIPYVFQNRRAAYIGDPHMLPGFVSFMETLGVSVVLAVVINRTTHTRELPPELMSIDTLVYPKMKTFTRFISSRLRNREIDFMMANCAGGQGYPVATLELGFPSWFNHALYHRPFLGFGGALALVDSLANIMRAEEVRAYRAGGGPGHPEPS